VAAAPVFTADVDTPPHLGRPLPAHERSSRLIGPFKHGSVATAPIFIWLEQVPELIPVVDVWLATPY
jgi:hypothetical protein